MSSFDVKKFGDEISSFVSVTITYCSRIIQFDYVVQKCYCGSFFSRGNSRGAIHCNMMTAVVARQHS